MARVLIVDDEPDYRSRLQYFLTGAGHAVAAVANGPQARQSAEAQPPDVLVVDWMLGASESGLTVARQLCATVPELQVILITGFVALASESSFGALDVFRTLTKPFSSQELIDAVHDACAQHDARNGTVGS